MLKQMLDGSHWEFKNILEDTWYQATVPGTLFADMMREGVLERPYYRFNEEHLLALGERDYEYRCVFKVEKELLNKKHQFIVFEGIDTIAAIFLNGKQIAATDNMHRTYRISVKNELKSKGNSLRIIFYSPVKEIAKKHAANPLPEFNTASLHGFSQIRKMHSAFRWDAEPLVPDSGLWRSVYLEGYDKIKLHNVYIKQRHENSKVLLCVEATFETESQEGAVWEARLFDSEGILECTLRGVAENGTNEFELEIPFPKLWWPNGYGEQPLYRLEVSLSSADGERDVKETKIGLRKAVVKQEQDEWGESFAFYVNDTPIFAKGACYTPPDKFITLCRGKRHEDLIKHCIAANYNCIRVWGGAVYPDDEFFDLCDQYGLLVWQDLMFACALYHVTDSFTDNIRAEAKDNVIRLRNHASLMLWCGSNENEWFHDYDHESEGLTNKLRMDNLRQYEVILKDVVHTYDPERLYWPSSPSSGGGYENPNGYEKGDVHCWYVWYLPAKPYTFYKECNGRFISEYGLESFQSIKTLSHYMEEEDMSPNSAVMDYMQHCSDNHCDMGNAKIVSYIFQEVKPPKNFDEYVFASQYAQAEGIKYGTLHWRRRKPRCMGTLYWQVVDCFPGTTWSSLDYEYRWKILHYYAKRFFAQVLVTAEVCDKKADLYVVNDNPVDLEARLEWTLRNQKGDILEECEQKINIEKSSSQLFVHLDFEERLKKDMPSDTYLEFTLFDKSGTEINSDTILFVKPKHFHFLQPKIDCLVTETKETFEISVSTSVYAKCIQLDFMQEEGVFSDNCFDLSPNRTKKVVLDKSTLSRAMTLPEFKNELFCRTLNSIGVSNNHKKE